MQRKTPNLDLSSLQQEEELDRLIEQMLMEMELENDWVHMPSQPRFDRTLTQQEIASLVKSLNSNNSSKKDPKFTKAVGRLIKDRTQMSNKEEGWLDWLLDTAGELGPVLLQILPGLIALL